MKANELMIGDWVEPHQSMTPTVYCKVEGIYPDGTVNLDKAERLFILDELTPILLTAEILEKNGFEKVYDGYKLPNYRIKWKSYTNLFFTVFTGVDGYWNHVGLGVIIGGVPATLDYVHQLQHALRLCGIEKTIEL